MPVFVFRNGEIVDKNDVVPDYTPGAAPNVISDSMEPTRHMATGKYHTSKSAFRADTKASGCIEVGNDSSLTKPRTLIPLDRGSRREAIRKSIYELKNGRVPQ